MSDWINRRLCAIQSLWGLVSKRPELLDIAGNTGWLFADKIIRMGVGLLVGVWMARYLGPEQFGFLSYVVAFVSLFSVFANLGLDSIVILYIVREPACAKECLGTAFVLKLAGAFVTILLALGAISFLRTHDNQSLILVAIISVGTIFQAFDTIDLWYQSQVRSKYVIFAKNPAFLAFSILKIIFIWQNAPLVAFAWAGTGEVALGAYGLLFIYRRNNFLLSAWQFSWKRAVRLLRDCCPLFFSGVFVTLYIKIDQVMLGQMLGDTEVGIYSAAVRLTDMWYFIPIAIVSSVFPAVVSAKKAGEAQYYERLQKLFLLMMWLSIAVAVPISIFAKPIVKLVFGSQYLSGATALSIMAWSGLFIFSGSVSNLWYLLEDLNYYTMYRHILGAGINIVLNFILIPRYGVSGAAVATLITQLGTSYLFDLINKPTRILFRIKSRYFFLFLPITLKYVIKLPPKSIDSN